MGEIGYLKNSFFNSLGFFKPAVTIFIFDLRKSTAFFDWKTHEVNILAKIKDHTERWQINNSVCSKYMVIIMFPYNNDTVNVEECKNSFKKAVQLSGDEHIKSSNYFLSTGFDSLKTTMQKQFSKKVNDLVVSYYREKKENVKKKVKKLIVGQIQHIRYTVKQSLYSLITSCDYNKSTRKCQEAYKLLKQQSASNSRGSGGDERRDNADIIAIVILKNLLMSNQLSKFLEFYKEHFFSWQYNIVGVKSVFKYEEIKWR